MNHADLVKMVYHSLDDKKADNIKIIDIREVTVIADYFIIAGGSNKNHIQTMADEVEKKLREAGVVPKQIEGYKTANWILMDFRDIIVHIFNEENRLFYNLEKIWIDGKIVSIDEVE